MQEMVLESTWCVYGAQGLIDLCTIRVTRLGIQGSTKFADLTSPAGIRSGRKLIISSLVPLSDLRRQSFDLST